VRVQNELEELLGEWEGMHDPTSGT
jgi:hypothetical protein